jgi:hypothetical protein
MLAGASMRLADAQRAVRAVVAAETLVAAHSGENDMHALKVDGVGWVGWW